MSVWFFSGAGLPVCKRCQQRILPGEKDKWRRSRRFFRLLENGYSKDAQHVFFESGQVAGADPQTFVLFKENENSLGTTVYARDKNGIYINEKAFAGADVATFKILNEKYTMDKNGVYFNMKKVKNADPGSFQVYPHYMGDADATDKNHKYKWTKGGGITPVYWCTRQQVGDSAAALRLGLTG